MNSMQKRIGKLEEQQQDGKGESWIDASLLTDAELQTLMDAKYIGGIVQTEAYGGIEVDSTAIVGAGYPKNNV